MRILRSTIAQIVMLVTLIIVSIICYIASYIVSKERTTWLLCKTFGFVRNITALIMGIKITYKGMDNIPEGAVIFASKHESAFETAFLFNEFKMNSTYALKIEIKKVPLWGRLAMCNDGIFIHRGNASTFRNFIKDVQKTLDSGKSFSIFPEGTRVLPNQRPKFKSGIAKIYSSTTAPIIPVALNTGDCFPKGCKVLRKAHIIVEFLPPIYREMNEQEFTEFLHKQINDKSEELHKLSFKK